MSIADPISITVRATPRTAAEALNNAMLPDIKDIPPTPSEIRAPMPLAVNSTEVNSSPISKDATSLSVASAAIDVATRLSIINPSSSKSIETNWSAAVSDVAFVTKAARYSCSICRIKSS